MNGACTATELLIEGIQAVRLENEWLCAAVLVGKGTDIWELVYKPLNLELLMRTKNGLTPYEGRDFREIRLVHYAEGYPGGWQEIIPNRALFGSGEVGASEEGESAGVPWEYRIDREDGHGVSLHCRLSLPYTPLTVEKTITLKAGERAIRLTERITNRDGDVVHLIWTHHPAFGAPFIGERAKVVLPKDSIAFNVLRYENNRSESLASFEEEITSVTLPGGKRKNLLEIDPRKADGEECYIPVRIPAEGEVGIDNPDLNVKLRLEWDRDAFPCLRYWSNNDEGKYTVALEPSTSWFSDIRDCIRHDNCISLQPMEERQFWLKIGVEQLQ
ncbi:DUF4432 family protein [Cohnella lupini]|uniref:Uncharacterized protein DUF4432 n=1 Tax=Cohnella lupini TaxID=1294267 RepID=A0A3D9IT20_9BACL|nr:DUF4432 family protein [Cohnella lupini]RED64835.1 uncharacterized protein DUF4432 [Cohnella lupini]